jgi:hypothetical protein
MLTSVCIQLPFSGIKYIVFSGELRKIAWAGIPHDLRPMAWQLLLVCKAVDLSTFGLILSGIPTLSNQSPFEHPC